MELTTARLRLHSTTVGDLAQIREIIQAPGTAEWWGEFEGSEDDNELLAGWTIWLGDQIIGCVLATEETASKYPSVAFDIMLASEQQGRGYGPEALRGLIDHFAARGHHRFTIDPNSQNVHAIKAYEKTGFRPIGIARRSEQLRPGEWTDNLMMDLLVEDLD